MVISYSIWLETYLLVVYLTGVNCISIAVLLVIQSSKRLLGLLRLYSEIHVGFHQFHFIGYLIDFIIGILNLKSVSLDRFDIHRLVIFNDMVLNKVVTVLLKYLFCPVKDFLSNYVALYIYVFFEVFFFKKKNAGSVNRFFP